MKKTVLFLIVLLFQLTASFGQTSQWAPYVKSSCYQGISSTAINYGYNQYGKGYEWNWKVKNNYTKTVTFNLSIKIGADKKDWGVFTLEPGKEHQHVSMYYSDPSVAWVIEISEVFLGTLKEPSSERCWAKCDNGIANCDKNTANTTASSNNSSNTNNLTEYNRSKQQLEEEMSRKNAEMQRQNQENSNRLQIYNNAIRAGVNAHNSGNYAEAKSQFSIAINNSNNQQDRNKAQEYYNKTVGLEKSQSKIQAVGDFATTAISALDELSRARKEEKRLKEEEEKQKKLEEEKQEIESTNILEEKWQQANILGDSDTEEGYQKALEMMVPETDRLNGMALNVLGYWYWKLEDYPNAMKYYKKAADKKDATGMYNLGVLYRLGQGTEIDPTLTIYWYHRSCEESYDKACQFLDNIKEGFKKEVSEGNLKNTMHLAYLYYLSKNYQEATNYYEQYLLSNHNQSKDEAIYRTIATMYFLEDYKMKDYSKALLWYKKIAALQPQENRIAYLIGYIYEKGEGEKMAIDYREALNWYLKIVDNESVDATTNKRIVVANNKDRIDAINRIADLYEKGGYGIEKDWNEAKNWYEKAALKGNAFAMNRLGYLYLKGEVNLEKDKKQSRKWYKMACKADKKYCD